MENEKIEQQTPNTDELPADTLETISGGAAPTPPNAGGIPLDPVRPRFADPSDPGKV